MLLKEWNNNGVKRSSVEQPFLLSEQPGQVFPIVLSSGAKEIPEPGAGVRSPAVQVKSGFEFTETACCCIRLGNRAGPCRSCGGRRGNRIDSLPLSIAASAKIELLPAEWISRVSRNRLRCRNRHLRSGRSPRRESPEVSRPKTQILTPERVC